MSQTTTERAAAIRAALKVYGYTSRDVSVKSDYYSMGSSIRIVIKNATVPSSVVKLIAEPHESIYRDQFGDILSGGNRFVFVEYSSEARKALAEPYLTAVQLAADEAHDNTLIPVNGLPNCLIGKGHLGYGYTLWRSGDGCLGEYYDVPTLSAHIGEMIVNS